MKPTAFLFALALPALASAQTQTIWRCGPDGRTYSATPCSEGRALDVAASRPAADVNAAQQLAERESRLAEAMQKERQRREAKTAGSGLAGFPVPAATVKPAAAPPRRPKHRAQRKPPEADGTWRATVPASRRTPG